MNTNKNIESLLNDFLPKNYKKIVCEKVGIKYNTASQMKIYRIRKFETENLEILSILVDLAFEQKKKKKALLKKASIS